MKKLVLALAVLILLGQGSAAFESKISSTCGEFYEPVISFSDPDNTASHPGPPNLYDQKLCVRGIDESYVADSCEEVTGFYLWSEGEQSHFSTTDTYSKNVCTGRMEVNLRSGSSGGCWSNETQLFSVSGTNNAHAASYNIFDQKVCGSITSPDNVTVSVDFNLSSSDTVYFDGNQLSGSQKVLPPAEFPYLVSEDSNNVAGLVTGGFQLAERDLGSKNTLSIKRKQNSASYYFPFTSGDHQTIQRRRQLVLDNQLMNRLKPSFGFFMPTTPTIKVALQPGTTIDSNISIGSGTHEITIRKTGNNKVRIY